MTRWIRRAVPSLAVTALCAAVAWPAAAQPAAAPFPAGKTVTISVGVAPGGTNDMLMRMVAHYIGKYLPGNPKVVARNMPGAGGRNLAAYLYAQAPRNGTEFAALQRAITTDRLIGDPNLPFNPVEFTWLGSPSRTTDICLAWHATTFHTLDDLRAREFIIAASGSSERNIFILQQLTDFKIRSIIGYPGGSEQNLALERGEVHGRCSQKMTPLIPIFHNDINVLGGSSGGVKVAHDFAHRKLIERHRAGSAHLRWVIASERRNAPSAT